MIIREQKITPSTFTEKMTSSTLFENCQFNNLKFDQITWGGLRKKIKSEFSNVVFSDCHFKWGSFSSCAFANVSFENCVLSGVSFDLCSFKDVKINSKLAGISFNRVVETDNFFKKKTIIEREFGYIDFSGSSLQNISFVGIDHLKNIGHFNECFVLKKEQQMGLSTLLRSTFGSNELTKEVEEILFRNIPFMEWIVMDFKNLKKSIGEENLMDILHFLKTDQAAKTLIASI